MMDLWDSPMIMDLYRYGTFGEEYKELHEPLQS